MVYHYYQYISLLDINSASTDTNTGLYMQSYLHCVDVLIPESTKLACKENFGIEKNWQIRSHSPSFSCQRFCTRISFNYTCSSFTNILPSNQFRLTHLPMFYPSDILPCMVCTYTNTNWYLSTLLDTDIKIGPSLV